MRGARISSAVLGLLLAVPAVAQAPPGAGPPAAAEARMQEGMRDMQRGDATAALAAFEQTLALLRQAQVPAGKDEATALLFAGIAAGAPHTKAGNEKATEYFRVAIPLFAAAQDSFDEGTAAAGLAVALEGLGRAAEARDAYLKALPLLPAAERRRERARALGRRVLLQSYEEGVWRARMAEDSSARRGAATGSKSCSLVGRHCSPRRF